MIKVLLFDLSKTLLFPRDRSYGGYLNLLHEQKLEELGDDYSFFDWFELNEELLQMIVSLRNKSLKFAIFTTGRIQEYSDLNSRLVKYFDPILTAADMGLKKDDSNTYVQIANQLEVDPESVLFVDDTFKNVTAAKEAGMNTVNYVGSDSMGEIVGLIKQ